MATLLETIAQLEADNAAIVAHVERLVKENERLRQVGSDQAILDRLETVRGNNAKALNQIQASFPPTGTARPGNTGFKDVGPLPLMQDEEVLVGKETVRKL